MTTTPLLFALLNRQVPFSIYQILLICITLVLLALRYHQRKIGELTRAKQLADQSKVEADARVISLLTEIDRMTDRFAQFNRGGVAIGRGRRQRK